jgi:hypothetical protein
MTSQEVCVYMQCALGGRFQRVTVVLWCAEFMRDRISCENTNRSSRSPVSVPNKSIGEDNVSDFAINDHILNTKKRVNKCSAILKNIFDILIPRRTSY